uniref:Uncharacterized protein n=1 Tax=Castor canadensis TaxID=51338 RepID=A0A8C0XHG4_CASCN
MSDKDNFDHNDFDIVEESEGLDNLENTEEEAQGNLSLCAEQLNTPDHNLCPGMMEPEGETVPLLITIKKLKS